MSYKSTYLKFRYVVRGGSTGVGARVGTPGVLFLPLCEIQWTDFPTEFYAVVLLCDISHNKKYDFVSH